MICARRETWEASILFFALGETDVIGDLFHFFDGFDSCSVDEDVKDEVGTAFAEEALNECVSVEAGFILALNPFDGKPGRRAFHSLANWVIRWRRPDIDTQGGRHGWILKIIDIEIGSARLVHLKTEWQIEFNERSVRVAARDSERVVGALQAGGYDLFAVRLPLRATEGREKQAEYKQRPRHRI
jgi:hypothetical protein